MKSETNNILISPVAVSEFPEETLFAPKDYSEREVIGPLDEYCDGFCYECDGGCKTEDEG